MTTTTLYSAMYGEIQQASLVNLELWRDVVQQEVDHPTNKSIGWDNRDHKLSVRLETLTAVIKNRYTNREGVRSGVRIREWEQLGFPE